ncbi:MULTISPECIES: DUF982 domain-containing protein [Aminobacter]|uniref:DUF982 domain-containing protein n=1 Tax=Aminobacter TaxID=31988 RepID=UPI002857832F|nr:DUF982 domain-containing protein [Aminobacter aminovorans]MDR7223743.1 hypothetical protein [Aminobacter aminovorans]
MVREANLMDKAMNDVRFPDPVKLTLRPWGERVVASSLEAIEFMNEHWPDWARGRSYRAAYRACRDALDGWRAPKEARKAFMKAASRAGLISSTKRRQHL